jgi:uncharacterized protein YcbK (DUF882 family)
MRRLPFAFFGVGSAVALAAVMVSSTVADAGVLPDATLNRDSDGPGEVLIIEGEHGSEPETYESFELVSLNTLETVTVKMRADAPFGESEPEVRHLMRCLRTQREVPIDSQLLVVMLRIARDTGGVIELFSGYRAPHHAGDHSYHTRAKAADIRVRDFPRHALFALARKLSIPGLGIYPSSGMIHIDVREVPYHWVDYSGPSR